MQWYDFLIVISLFLLALGFLFFGALRKKRGKPLPGDDCVGNCSSCGKTCAKGKYLVEEYHRCHCSSKEAK